MKLRTSLWLVIIALATHICVESADLDLQRNQFYIGPEWYHAERSKEGGTRQQGNMIGIRAGYDRFKRYGWYIGTNASYATGTLDGHSSIKRKIRSHLTDISAEVRAGYTFQQKTCWKLSITPFVGGGYFVEKNYFIKPTESHFHFKTYYSYITTGFFFRMYPREHLEIGLNFKARWPTDPKCHIDHDDVIEPITQNIKEQVQYRLELPMTYRLGCQGPFAVVLAPFYERREYGGRINFPFDFIKTQFNIWGAALLLEYQM